MSTTLLTLQQYSFFSEARSAFRDEILAVAAPFHVGQGAYFFQKGEAVQSIGLVGAGSVRVFIIGENGREVTLYHVGPGETCPINLLCALLSRGALADAYIEADLRGVIIPATDFRAWAAKESVVCHFVLEALATRLINVLGRVEELTFQRIDRRIAEYLLYRLERTAADGATVHVTHENIASEIGSAREVVTRVLKTLERSGAIQLGRGSIVVRDEDLLRDGGGGET